MVLGRMRKEKGEVWKVRPRGYYFSYGVKRLLWLGGFGLSLWAISGAFEKGVSSFQVPKPMGKLVGDAVFESVRFHNFTLAGDALAPRWNGTLQTCTVRDFDRLEGQKVWATIQMQDAHWTVEAKSGQIQDEVVTLQGGVVLNNVDAMLTIRADHMKWDKRQSGRYQMNGNVKVSQKGQKIEADGLEGRLNSAQYRLKNARFVGS